MGEQFTSSHKWWLVPSFEELTMTKARGMIRKEVKNSYHVALCQGFMFNFFLFQVPLIKYFPMLRSIWNVTLTTAFLMDDPGFQQTVPVESYSLRSMLLTPTYTPLRTESPKSVWTSGGHASCRKHHFGNNVGWEGWTCSEGTGPGLRRSGF